MSDDNVIDYLREQFARLHTKIDRTSEDLHDIKVRMTSIEEGVAGLNRRMDRLDARVEHIERRLDLVGPAA